MAVFKISEADCLKILALPKRIEHDIHWSMKGDGAWAEAKLPVNADWPGHLEVVITVNTQLPSKYSITVLLNQAYRIKGLDINGSHSNKCTDKQTWVCQTHKHGWSDVCPDGHAYTPADITGETIEVVLKQFCEECNIVFKSSYRPVPMVPRMGGV